jgi:hypothetical protein
MSIDSCKYNPVGAVSMIISSYTHLYVSIVE